MPSYQVWQTDFTSTGMEIVDSMLARVVNQAERLYERPANTVRIDRAAVTCLVLIRFVTLAFGNMDCKYLLFQRA